MAGKESSDVYFDALRCKTQCFRALPDLLANLQDSVRNAKSIPFNNLDSAEGMGVDVKEKTLE